jgi:mRNA-degrading endonuclease RelE of RelBE toxin-antitoxin system
VAWAVVAHHGFQRELKKLEAEDSLRVKEALAAIVAQLDRLGSLDPRKVAGSGGLAPVPDLQPLQATGIPGSYRLRAGRFRVSLALLPDERLMLVTAIARRGESTYDSLPEVHRRRFYDR